MDNKFILPNGNIDDRPILPWYDTREGLKAYLETGLGGLWKIAKARREAYARDERLSEWCLLGCFYTDACGNLSLITEGAPVDAYRFMKYEGPLPTVISKEETMKYTDTWTATMGVCLPAPDARCDRCGRGWTIDNVRDFYARRDGSPRHRECQRLAVIERETEEIGDIVRRAEIPFTAMHMIPNEYYQDPEFFGPWFMVETPFGRIKLGWRKRVINIDWSHTKLQVGPEVFASESVTKWSTGIHAWGADKAVEYLRKIWDALGPKEG